MRVAATQERKRWAQSAEEELDKGTGSRGKIDTTRGESFPGKCSSREKNEIPKLLTKDAYARWMCKAAMAIQRQPAFIVIIIILSESNSNHKW